MTLDDLRAFAATLPGTSEAPHFELWSFRVGTRIYATFPPDAPELRVFVDEAGVHAAVAREPDAVAPLHWGAKLAGVRVQLEVADAAHVRALLVAAWARKAPRRVVAAWEARPDAERR
jgi:hypothetical protein